MKHFTFLLRETVKLPNTSKQKITFFGNLRVAYTLKVAAYEKKSQICFLNALLHKKFKQPINTKIGSW